MTSRKETKAKKPVGVLDFFSIIISIDNVETQRINVSHFFSQTHTFCNKGNITTSPNSKYKEARLYHLVMFIADFVQSNESVCKNTCTERKSHWQFGQVF